MNGFGQLVFAFYPFLCVYLVRTKPLAFSTAFCLTLGACFLPVHSFAVVGMPDLDKFAFANVCLFIVVVLTGRLKIKHLRLNLADLFIFVWVLEPLLTSLTNNLGLYDGLSGIVQRTLDWFIPYFLGRMSIRSSHDLFYLFYAVLWGVLLYTPFFLWETRMSPQLHLHIYGIRQHSFAQTIRAGGWRPMVFMEHGLQAALWMGMGLITAIALAGKMRVHRLGRLQTKWGALLISIPVLLCASLGAQLLTAIAVTTGFFKTNFQRLILLALTLAIIGYIVTRTTSVVDLDALRDIAVEYFPAERAQSLLTRLNQEEMLVEKALERPLLGWGGWGRSRLYDEFGNDITISDSLWIIVLGTSGIVGLISLYGFLLFPLIRVSFISNPQTVASASVALAALLLMVQILDSTMNNMILPLCPFIAGLLTTCAGKE